METPAHPVEPGSCGALLDIEQHILEQRAVFARLAPQPALHRLEERGLVSAEWGASENNRRAKFYELTPQGKARLRVEVASWERYAAAVSAALVAPALR